MSRRTILVPLVLAVAAALLVAGVAVAGVFFQSTHLTADGSRVDKHHVMISGRLTASHHKKFCTHGRKVTVTELKDGTVRDVFTDSTGNYSAQFPLGRHHHSDFTAAFGGRVSGTHPNRHVCRHSHAKTHV
jgi:hypothetical protein